MSTAGLKAFLRVGIAVIFVVMFATVRSAHAAATVAQSFLLSAPGVSPTLSLNGCKQAEVELNGPAAGLNTTPQYSTNNATWVVASTLNGGAINVPGTFIDTSNSPPAYSYFRLIVSSFSGAQLSGQLICGDSLPPINTGFTGGILLNPSALPSAQVGYAHIGGSLAADSGLLSSALTPGQALCSMLNGLISSNGCSPQIPTSYYGVNPANSDNSTQFQAAWNAACLIAALTGGAQPVVGIGVFNTGPTFIPCSNVLPIGMGAGVSNFPAFVAIPATTVLKCNTPTSTPLLAVDPNYNSSVYLTEQGRNGLVNIALDGNNNGTTDDCGIGLAIGGNQDFYAQGVQLSHFGTEALDLYGELLTGINCSPGPCTNTKGDSLNGTFVNLSIDESATGDGECAHFSGPTSGSPASDADRNSFYGFQCVHLKTNAGVHFLSSDSNTFYGAHINSTGSGTAAGDVLHDCGSHGNTNFQGGFIYIVYNVTGCTSGDARTSDPLDSFYGWLTDTFSTVAPVIPSGASGEITTDDGDDLKFGVPSGNYQQYLTFGNQNSTNRKPACGNPTIQPDSGYANLQLGFGMTCAGQIQLFANGLDNTETGYFDTTALHYPAVYLTATSNQIVFVAAAGGGSILNQNTTHGTTFNQSLQISGNTFQNQLAGVNQQWSDFSGVWHSTAGFSGPVPNSNLGHVPTGQVLFASTGVNTIATGTTANTFVQASTCATLSPGCSSGVLSITTPAVGDGTNAEFLIHIHMKGWVPTALTGENVQLCVGSSQSTNFIPNAQLGSNPCGFTIPNGTRIAGTPPFGLNGASQAGLMLEADAYQIVAASTTVSYYCNALGSTTTSVNVLNTCWAEGPGSY